MGGAYSNIGYLKVAQLIERASGLPLNDALDQLAFKPCELATARLAKRFADLHDVQLGGIPDYHPGWVFHGLVVGTVADAVLFLKALTTGKLLRPSTFAEMLKGRPLPAYRTEHLDPAYGLGLMLSADRPLDRPVGHMGEGPGSSTAVLARRGKVAAVWTTVSSSAHAQEQATRRIA